MDIHIRKKQLVRNILGVNDEQVLIGVENFLKRHKSNKDIVFEPMTVEELNQRIDQSEKDFENGAYSSNEELLAKYK